MDDQTRIWKQPELQAHGKHEACLVHIYPTGPNMGTRYRLTEQSLSLGRDEDCQIRITDDSVSRRHARIQFDPKGGPGGGYTIRDLGSTNGTFVNNVSTKEQRLDDGDYIRVGNCIFRFLTGGNLEAEYHEEIYRLTILDALTETHNKRYLLEFLARELTCAVRYRRPLSLVMIDIDRFKKINDQRGHLCGDFALRQLAAALKPALRKDDLLARYGGEEFAVVLPDTPIEQALMVAERLREITASTKFEFEGDTFPVTISLGLAAVTGEEWAATTELIQRADAKLFEAKRDGRNCVRS